MTTPHYYAVTRLNNYLRADPSHNETWLLFCNTHTTHHSIDPRYHDENSLVFFLDDYVLNGPASDYEELGKFQSSNYSFSHLSRPGSHTTKASTHYHSHPQKKTIQYLTPKKFAHSTRLPPTHQPRQLLAAIDGNGDGLCLELDSRFDLFRFLAGLHCS